MRHLAFVVVVGWGMSGAALAQDARPAERPERAPACDAVFLGTVDESLHDALNWAPSIPG